MAETRASGRLPSLYVGSGAQHYHELACHDDTEITSVLSYLKDLPDAALAGRRVLELACGSGRVTLPMAAAGHRVLATDLSTDMLSILAKRLAEPRARRSEIADRIEIQQADMVSFDVQELFKAVCLSTASITLLDSEQRRGALRCIVAHLAIGGAFIVSTDHVLPEAPTTNTVWLRPDMCLIEEIDHVGRRRRTVLRCGGEEYVSELHLVTPENLANDLREVGFTLTAQRSSADPTLPHHANVVLGAVYRRRPERSTTKRSSP